METLNNIALLGMIGLAILYLFFRFFLAGPKRVDVYEQQLERVLNSDEYKVKGRFE